MTSKENVIIQQPNAMIYPPDYPPNCQSQRVPILLISGCPQPKTICPPGWEYLILLDKIFIHQEVEAFEIVTGLHDVNRYTVMDSRGKPLYIIREMSHWFDKCCFGSSRSFEMSIIDPHGYKALHIKRPFDCFGDKMTVYHAETFIGSVNKIMWSCSPKFQITDECGEKILSIEGSIWFCGATRPFWVLTNDGSHIGIIDKQYSGTIRELFTNADNYSVTFPVSLNVKAKMLLLATTLLIDYAYFENKCE